MRASIRTAPPSDENTGSGMSMPCSRMHSANASISSRVSASMLGIDLDVAHRLLEQRLARRLGRLELLAGHVEVLAPAPP